MAQTYEEIVTLLTAEGAPFEISIEPVRGIPMKNFKNRERSLREKIRSAAAHGEADCIVQGDRRIGYAEFARLVWGAANALKSEFGLRRGDRLGVLAYNSPDWLIALFGATSLGGIGVGLNGWWKSEEIQHGLVDSGSRFLVVDERLYPRLEGIRRDLPDLERIFYIGEHPPPGTVPIEELLVPSEEPPSDPVDEDDPFVILYTSGTTGKPKGCITTHRGTITQVLGSVLAGVTSALLEGTSPINADGGQTVSLLTTPLFHVGGLHTSVCTGLTVGTKLVFSTGKFEPEQVMALIERERVSIWGAVPTMLRRVVHSENVSKYDLSSLRAVSFGGAPTPPETIEKAREVLPIEPSFAHAYGLTETHGVVTLNPGRALLDKPTSIGRPTPVLDIRMVDQDRVEVPDGTPGELAIFGPTVTPGYWNVSEAENLDGGWLYTGDVAYRDKDGFLFVVDRASDMILRGGENIYCAEVENVLAEHPEIEEAAVIGVSDPDLGERVKAIVRRVRGSELSDREVRAHVAAYLADFKVPEFVEFISEALPRNPTGKILKNILRGKGGVAFELEELE